MFGKRLTLFRLLGFEVRIDLSWLVLALLVTWSLATVLFPYSYEGLARSTYWWMGVTGAYFISFPSCSMSSATLSLPDVSVCPCGA